MSSEFIEDIRNSEDNITVSTPKKKNSVEFEVEDYISKFLDISNDAKQRECQEKNMSLKEGLTTFPKAAMWSIILSTAIIMEGYDTNLLGSLYAFPAFAKQYGQYFEDQDKYEIPAKWQTMLAMCANLGEIIGLFLAGIIADRIGYRYTLIGALFLVSCFIFIVFFSSSLGTLITGELLLGIPWGAFQTLTVTYASEVCPLVLRVYLTTYVNMCWVFGQLISSGILKVFSGSTESYAYKIPFSIQWIWPLPIAIGIYLAPESPWWLVRRGRNDDAKKSLSRLMSQSPKLPDKSIVASAMLRNIQITLESEHSKTKNKSYLDCFKGKNLRRTRIAAFAWMIQNCTGSSLMGYSTYFYEQAGLSVSDAFSFSIAQYLFGIIGTIGSWFLSQKLGRFDIYFGGLCINFCVLMIVGGLGCSSSPEAAWGVGFMLLIFTFVYDLTIGPICYCLVAEIPSTILRTKTVVLARNLYNITGVIVAVITPYMLNPTAWNWKAKTGFFWGSLAFISAIWAWFELPETKGKTFAELDALFAANYSARDFKYAEIDVFDTGRMIEDLGEEGIRNFVNVTKKDEEIPLLHLS